MDQVTKFLTHDTSAQFIFIDATDSVAEILSKTGCYPPAGIHLGQALLSCFLTHFIFEKDGQRKTKLQWNVRGDFGNIYVDVNEKNEGRGVIQNPKAFSGKIDQTLGEGVLQVLRQVVKLNTGIVISKGDVCTDILEYLNQSEQRRCALNLWINFDTSSEELKLKSALGYYFEVFPQKDLMRTELIANFWEEKLSELGSLSSWGIDLDQPIESMARISLEGSAKKTTTEKIYFNCSCSKDRAERALAFANKQDQSNLQLEAEIKCEYCGEIYKISLK